MKRSNWQDENWLLLLEAYLRRPTGLKPRFSRPMVDLSLELHVPPQEIEHKMKQIQALSTPRLERIWKEYANTPARLARAVKKLRSMKGFGAEEEFYRGVELNETFERDFRPIAGAEHLKPVDLIIILDLYFHLTPITMVPETPEVREMARMIGITPDQVVEVLDEYLILDPFRQNGSVAFTALHLPCLSIFQRYGNDDIERLSELVEELKEYYK